MHRIIAPVTFFLNQHHLFGLIHIKCHIFVAQNILTHYQVQLKHSIIDG